MKKIVKNKGFTLIEILVVIAIIAILAAIVLVAINPAKRFQDARNTQRRANVESILSAVQQNMVDNKGIFTCAGPGAIPAVATVMEDTGGYDIAECISAYLLVLPVDPQNGSWTDDDNYDTDYTIKQDATTKQVTINAPSAPGDGGGTISVTR
ncbi:hypothetical protein A3A95_02275 [Candidatus Nomurabacteria bacterium RIFCSPLOWO2_01_FULL_39_18]|uniref:Type II secretion system protein GspG C-terminal domain-containing protein n=1 Tax=Candidatus Nomurabacteria bacterium RIFCSPHIGHO2_01_FULL_40_24b TaxID=1801739 RepID=A0A1F6V649_9BACT|nr:MAG: hypothetical protein A2647_02030 [Candidatus Nomurabacteria bacterium RIFCSPHIGHO2_01_FULL_40_24b]OGI90689.1 MAG: hypothetical protein A3A95_02275 [Candidatus Nomurabacteria bacterium RIFCSPLOWO2_01_FULL_39_18]